MKILHICSYYIGSLVYRNLFEELSELKNVESQYVFIPIRSVGLLEKNKSQKEAIDFFYTKALNIFTRLSFGIKLLSLVKAFRVYNNKIQEVGYDLIHAHTLYSDGFLAYLINRKSGIPYVITARVTDIEVYDKLLPHWHWLAKRVIGNAQSIVILSKSAQAYIEDRYSGYIRNVKLIPNGADKYWIDNALLRKYNGSSVKSAIYVGEFSRNKNIKSAIYAFFAVQKDEGLFIAIGGSYRDFIRIYGELPKKLLKKIIFIEKTQDKELVRAHLEKSNLLIMPSFRETFGLVYLESLSQCTPVVYSEGQGIDGLYPEGFIGFKCNPRSRESIKDAIRKVLERFPYGLDFTGMKANPVVNFSWKSTASSLLKGAY